MVAARESCCQVLYNSSKEVSQKQMNNANTIVWYMISIVEMIIAQKGGGESIPLGI